MNLTCPKCSDGAVLDPLILDDADVTDVKCCCCGWEGSKEDLIWTFRVSCLCQEDIL